jgi:hypothetical protein
MTNNITIRVKGHIAGDLPVVLIGAKVTIRQGNASSTPGPTAPDGSITVALANNDPQGSIHVEFGNRTEVIRNVALAGGESRDVTIELPDVMLEVSADGATWEPASGDTLLQYAQKSTFRLQWKDSFPTSYWACLTTSPSETNWSGAPKNTQSIKFPAIQPASVGQIKLYAALAPNKNEIPQFDADSDVTLNVGVAQDAASSPVQVSLRRTGSRMTEDVPLWVDIRKGTNALSFERYLEFMEWLFCGGKNPHNIKGDFANLDRRALPFTDTDAYKNIKFATEAFVMANCSVFSRFHASDAQYVDDQLSVDVSAPMLASAFAAYRDNPQAPHTIAYLAIIRRKLLDQGIKDVDIGDVALSANPAAHARATTCYGILRKRLTHPCFLELIWSYWQEEGMLNQTMNAISRRFQNVRGPLPNDPLANTEIDPLRPLNNILWGYVQDEQHRLSVVRRNYEYDHHYGLRLAGKAVNNVRTADSRSRFLEAFHTLLSTVSAFYKRDDDTTIVADGFPVLNALKEAHLILSQGAHGQFGDLPSTARIEMLMQQWILARPEFREFLPTRIMVAYPEPWMDRVDAMKKLQNWSDTSVLHFRNLAIFGEQILLSVRYGAWAAVNDPWQAVNWARYWRPEVQGYLHAYRSVTGVDLSVDVTNARIDSVMPSVHLVKRLSEQKIRTA